MLRIAEAKYLSFWHNKSTWYKKAETPSLLSLNLASNVSIMKRVMIRLAIKSDAMQTDIATYIRFYREAHSCHYYVSYYNIYLGTKLQFLH